MRDKLSFDRRAYALSPSDAPDRGNVRARSAGQVPPGSHFGRSEYKTLVPRLIVSRLQRAKCWLKASSKASRL